MFFEHKKCRCCRSEDLIPVLDLGVQPIANDFAVDGGERAGFAPLKVLFCRVCTLAQLSVVVKPETLYSNYSYVTSASATMKAHFDLLLNDIANEIPVGFERLKMLEIGSNTGEFLIHARKHFDGLGIEPAKNLCGIANQRQVETRNRLWNTASASELHYESYRADVIVARHVFAHIDDWQDFIHACGMVSHGNTLIVIECPWVVDMFKMNSWDQVYHEHLSYVSVTAIHKLLENTPFCLDDVKHYEIHGGSIALMIRRNSTPPLPVQKNKVLWECEENLERDWVNLKWQQKLMVGSLKTMLYSVAPKVVCGFGASAKATVWINAMGLTKKDIAFVCDSTPQKQGKVVPGSDIPIVPESEILKAQVAINFAWNFPEVYERFKGVQWISPCPDVKLL